MLKNHTGKKIWQIMEKTTVDFILLASSIYHCVFFLDPPLVMSDGDPIWPQAACWRLPGIYCQWLTPSFVNLVTLHSAGRLQHHRVGQNLFWGGAIASPQAAATWREVVCLIKMALCSMGDDSALGSWRLLSQFSPQSYHPQFQASLVHFAPPLPESRVSGYK